MTHSCARMIICRPLASQNSLTRSGPNVTRPGPRAFGRSPMTLSFSVGSLRSHTPCKSSAKAQHATMPPRTHLHSRSMSTMPPVSMVSGRCGCSSCSTLSMDFPMPPAMTRVRLSPRKQFAQLRAERTVHADDALLDNGGERHPVENVVEPLPRPETTLLAFTKDEPARVSACTGGITSQQHQAHLVAPRTRRGTQTMR